MGWEIADGAGIVAVLIAILFFIYLFSEYDRTNLHEFPCEKVKDIYYCEANGTYYPYLAIKVNETTYELKQIGVMDI